MFSLMGTNYAWTQEATYALLSLWGKEDIQKQLKEARRNRFVFEKIAESLNAMGYEFTWKQCRNKVKNLCQVYRKTIRENAGKDGDPSCPYFEELSYIFNPSGAPVPLLFQKNSSSLGREELLNVQESGHMSHASESLTTHPEEQALLDRTKELVQPQSSSTASMNISFGEEEEDEDENDDEDEEEDEEDEEENLMDGVKQQWQSMPLMLVAPPEENIPQRVVYQPALKTKGSARVRQESIIRAAQDTSRHHILVGQQQQQGIGRKQGLVRQEASTSQQVGVVRMEPFMVQHQKDGPRSIRRLKRLGHRNVKNPGNIFVSGGSLHQQQTTFTPNIHSSEILEGINPSTFQEQTFSRLSDSNQEIQNDQRQGGHSRKRSGLDSEILELIGRLHEEAEDREDARQRRLLEHEKRMDERRQQWEEERRERELQQQQHITQMFLQTVKEICKQLGSSGEQDKSSDTSKS